MIVNGKSSSRENAARILSIISLNLSPIKKGRKIDYGPQFNTYSGNEDIRNKDGGFDTLNHRKLSDYSHNPFSHQF